MNSTQPADLLEFKAQFDHWRSIRPYIRQPIPEELRHAAFGNESAIFASARGASLEA